MKYTNEQIEMINLIESLKTANGGWTRESLAILGVKWPPRKGWKKDLIESAKYLKRSPSESTSKGEMR